MAEINPKTTVFDVAAYILGQAGEMSTWKLQKLVYYSQAWSLVWDNRPLFPEPIEAWANGPVCPDLYKAHRGQFLVRWIAGNPDNLDDDARETVDGVVAFYGKFTSQQLSDLTHLEWPWRQARGGLPPGAPGHVVIRLDVMAGYYESIPAPDHESE